VTLEGVIRMVMLAKLACKEVALVARSLLIQLGRFGKAVKCVKVIFFGAV